MKHLNQHVLAVAVAATFLPTVAMDHQGARVTVGGVYQHLAIGQAAGNLPGITFGISQRAEGIGIRARLAVARANGAELDSGSVRFLAYPGRRVSPYLTVGGLSLSGLGGVAVTTDYAVNPTSGVITPVAVTAPVAPVGVTMGFVFAGLHAAIPVNSALSLVGHVAIGAGLGGSETGLPPAMGARSEIARSYGVAMRYRLAGGPVLSVAYDRESIPVRGATFKSGGVAVSVSYLFH